MKKIFFSATIQILPSFVRFLNYIELFWEKVAFLFFQGREMSRVYIYIYIYINTCILGRTYSVERSIHLIEEH